MKILRVFAWLYPSYAQMNVAAAVVGSAVVGGAMSSAASSKASKAQGAAADQANATQRYQFDETNRLNAPFRDVGVSANNRLASLLGITQDKYKTYGSTRYDPSNPFTNQAASAEYQRLSAENGPEFALQQVMDGWGAQLNPVSDEQYAAYKAQQESSDGYGSLLKKFDQNDLNKDVVYQSGLQFGLDQGTQGINRIAAASGSQLSGATLKALTRFGNDYGSTKANESYNRYNNDQNSVYNKQAGVSGAGQQATNQINSAGQNMANNISANQIGLGNARGASAISGANSFNNALSSGVNAYQQNQLMNSFNRPQQASYGSGGMGGFGDSYSTSYGE